MTLFRNMAITIAVCAFFVALAPMALAADDRPATPSAPEPLPNLPAPEQASVNFSFDQVDLRILVKLVSEITGRRFVLDEETE